MKYLFLALVGLVAVTPADAEDRDVTYARCLMQALEHNLQGEMQHIYIDACMRVAGYARDSGGLTGGAQYMPVVK